MNTNGTGQTPVVVSVSGIERIYGAGETAVRVLCGVDLTIHEGELVALYGPSGSGKTTLLNLIGALDLPTAGTINVAGKDIIRLSENARTQFRCSHIGFIFQNYTLLPTYTALENIDLALRLPGLGFFERRKRAKAALSVVGLSAWGDHVPDELSGGQRQRVAIARALALQPPLILADEPTSGLDTQTARRTLSLFRGIAATQRMTFLIVSHDPIVAEFVDTAYDLNDGRLLAHLNAPVTTNKKGSPL